jgi:hypothetical protein
MFIYWGLDLWKISLAWAHLLSYKHSLDLGVNVRKMKSAFVNLYHESG